MSRFPVDELEDRLRQAAGIPAFVGQRPDEDSRSFYARPDVSARVQIDHIDGRPVGGVAISLRGLTPDAAEAVLRFLSSRNERNSLGGFA
ncbi:hypothetical protein E4M02_10990 [Brevundimonas sp. S30B]|uniref:NIL domain-containing protein n=1 Tax=unclassified Brevundimonas TaxID=2622653 RepID=UPI001071A47E|nr:MULTISPECIES: NIL domain-containing protein [unclassified Brevundimonas]QBX38639.1 hypothetical protein E4M01_13250 [Brevundimonas sp. MF30-B]TFW01230.1 hypothetical protein E4M02_10990 [Brevundimonas sp. S30B]